jgi:hypothetical protein
MVMKFLILLAPECADLTLHLKTHMSEVFLKAIAFLLTYNLEIEKYYG